MFSNGTGTVSRDVVACETSAYIVQAMANTGLTLLKLESQKAARHRANVVPDHWSDLAQSGLPVQDVVIRCVPIKRYGSANLTRLGAVPDTLRDRTQSTLKREAVVRLFEDSPSVQSNLLASTASRGRRVGAVRYN